MNKKKIVSIVISVALAILSAVLGCAFGIDVDFSGAEIVCVETEETGMSL